MRAYAVTAVAAERERAHNAGFVEASRLQGQEIERLRAGLRTAINTLERDGDEWNICEHLREALGPNTPMTAAPRAVD